MNRRAAATALLLTFGAGLRAEINTSSTVEFLRQGFGARPQALGNAALASRGAEAIYWNPALLGRVRERSVSLMYGAMLETASDQQAAYALPLGRFGAAAISYHSQTLGQLQGTDDNDQNIDAPTPRDTAAGLAWGRSFGRWQAGLAGQWVQSKIMNTASTYALSGGVAGAAGPVDLSLAAANWGEGLVYDDAVNPLPSLFRADAAWRMSRRVLITIGGEWGPDLPAEFSAGAEYAAPLGKSMQGALRAGMDSLSSRVPGLTNYRLGAGVQRGSVSFDYVWAPTGELGDVHRVSMSWRLGGGAHAQAAPDIIVEAAAAPRAATAVDPAVAPAPMAAPKATPVKKSGKTARSRKEAEACGGDLYYKAMRQYGQNHPRQALKTLRQARDCDPLNKDVREAITRITREIEGGRR